MTASSQDLVSQLIELSNQIGSDTEYTRSGGGNSSAKNGDTLLIKPSGVPLATLREEDLVPLDIPTLLHAFEHPEELPSDKDPVRAAAQLAQRGAFERRPSVEILFHALIPDPLVIHLHPLTANAITCNTRGEELCKQILGDQALWVDYTDPGIPLARLIDERRRAFTATHNTPPPAITLLGNHGIIVSGPTKDAILERIDFLTSSIRAAIEEAGTAFSGSPSRVAEAFRRAVAAPSVALSTEGLSVSASAPGGPLIPDQIVYAGSFPVVLEATDTEDIVAAKVSLHRAQHGRAPIVALIPGLAVAAVGSTNEAADNALHTFLDAMRVARDANLLGRVRVMDDRERGFIENWEAESYRQKVAASQGS